jgi:hypothetical protein
LAPLPRSTQSRVQQFESLSQGIPSCLQPPEGASQRPGWPAAAGGAHRPEQQSSGRQHESPVALQVYAGAQRPCTPGAAPWQLCEQHWSGPSQRSPRTSQVAPVEPAGSSAQDPPVQTPEQHSAPPPQAVPIVLHAAESHVAPGEPAPGQRFEQQSAFEPQAVPGPPQNAAVVHFRSVPQIDEQHWLPLEQPAPTSPQGGGGGTTENVTPSVCGVLYAPADDTETVAVYVPAASAPRVGRTVSEKGAEPPETSTASQPEPAPYATDVAGAASDPPPAFDTATSWADGLAPPAFAANASAEGESPIDGCAGSAGGGPTVSGDDDEDEPEQADSAASSASASRRRVGATMGSPSGRPGWRDQISTPRGRSECEQGWARWACRYLHRGTRPCSRTHRLLLMEARVITGARAFQRER